MQLFNNHSESNECSMGCTVFRKVEGSLFALIVVYILSIEGAIPVFPMQLTQLQCMLRCRI